MTAEVDFLSQKVSCSTVVELVLKDHMAYGCCSKSGVPCLGVLIVRALLFWGLYQAHDFWKLL